MRHRVKTVTITAFRQIHDLKLSLHPRLTTLIGLNGSGKSSILEAIHVKQATLDYHHAGVSLVTDPPQGVDRLISDAELSVRPSNPGDMTLDDDELALFGPQETKALGRLLRLNSDLSREMARIFTDIVGRDTGQTLEVEGPADLEAPLIVRVWRDDVPYPIHHTSRGTREIAVLSIIIAFRKALAKQKFRQDSQQLRGADVHSVAEAVGAGSRRSGGAFVSGSTVYIERGRANSVGRGGGRHRITMQPGLLLLDEPGLGLHPGAQQRLRDYLKEHSQHQQILLATHSPFLIDLEFDGGSGIRAVELERSRVSARPLEQARDHRALLPWHEAVGLDMTRRVLLEQPTLLVEGPSDRHYLTAMSGFCGTALRAGVGLVQGGGTRRMVLTVSTLTSFDRARGRGSELIVLLDSDTNNADAAEIAKMAERVIRCGDFARDTGTRDQNLGEIEDLFDPEDYLRLFLRRYPHLDPVVAHCSGRPPQERHIRCQGKTLPKAITEMLQRIGDPLAGTNFHAEVSQQVADDPGLLAQLRVSDATRQRFARLIAAINRQVDEIRASRSP